MITNKNFEIEYINETLEKMLDTNSIEIFLQLKNMKMQDGKLLFDTIKVLNFPAGSISIYLGITEIKEFLYNWSVKLIT